MQVRICALLLCCGLFRPSATSLPSSIIGYEYAFPPFATFLAIEQKPMEEVNWPMGDRVGWEKAKLTSDLWSWAYGLQLQVHCEKVGLGWCESEERRETKRGQRQSHRCLGGDARSSWVFANALRIGQSCLLNPDWVYDQLTSMIR
jgi:hypothetical protein